MSIVRELLEEEGIFGHFGEDFEYILRVEEHYSR